MACKPHPYSGLKASLLTQHGKEAVICPELQKMSACEVVHIADFDTDQLGAFSREVPRYGSQLDAARKKARIGMDRSGLSIGIASEGAFGKDPYLGQLAWNYEIVVLLDDIRGIEIIGHSNAGAQNVTKPVSSWDELNALLGKVQFPSHYLTLRPNDPDHPEYRKGIDRISLLKESYDWARGLSRSGIVFVENDLRAHANPTRMTAILQATQQLAQKMNSVCPACASPGFWITETKRGLPCSLCSAPTHVAMATIWSCLQCDHQDEALIPDRATADPSKCAYCNP